jgi:2-dehydro-3-deoxygalactonokinase
MTNRNEARLIALDWGTSFCRAYLLGDGGPVIAERREPSGIMAVATRTASAGKSYERAFDRTFETLCGDWLETAPGLPVIACGMIGSNHGWAEAEYRRVPTDLAEADIALTTVLTRTGATVHIIPGLIAELAVPDVMRGEETQILGALTESLRSGTLDTSSERIVMLPGTHSKWVRVSGTTVADFATYMTGELYALLTTNSTLSRLATHAVSPDWEAFERGLDVAASPAGHAGILHTAFSARTLAMTGGLAPHQVEDYISGLLIGHEIAGFAASWLGEQPSPVLLCGDTHLTDRYHRALVRLGVPVELAGGDCAPVGMWQVALATGLVVGTTLLDTGADPERLVDEHRS